MDGCEAVSLIAVVAGKVFASLSFVFATFIFLLTRFTGALFLVSGSGAGAGAGAVAVAGAT